MALISNSTAAPYLDGTLTAATFLGAPLIAYGDGLLDTTPRWQAASNFADALGAILGTSAPLIGLNTTIGGDFALLRAALLQTTRFYSPNLIDPLPWSDGGVQQYYPVCGPMLCLPSDEAARANTVIVAGADSEHYIRTRSTNLYGIGCFACGPNIDPDERLTPPVYDCGPTILSNPYRSPVLQQLLNVWRRGGPVVLSSYATLLALEITRPGISSRTHAALVPYVELT